MQQVIERMDQQTLAVYLVKQKLMSATMPKQYLYVIYKQFLNITIENEWLQGFMTRICHTF